MLLQSGNATLGHNNIWTSKARRHFCFAVAFMSNRISHKTGACDWPLVGPGLGDWCLMQFSLPFTGVWAVQVAGIFLSTRVSCARRGLPSDLETDSTPNNRHKRRFACSIDCNQLTSIGPNLWGSDTFWSSESFFFLFSFSFPSCRHA